MRSSSCWALAFALSTSAAAGETPSGLYSFSESGRGRMVERNDGAGTIVLNDLLAKDLGRASVTSVSNDNSRFRLHLPEAGPVPAGADQKPLALVIDGVPIVVSSHSDRAPGGIIELGAVIDGNEAATKVGRELGVKPRLRRHPGHRLLVTCRPEKPTYHPGEPVKLVLAIKNAGKRTIGFMDWM